MPKTKVNPVRTITYVIDVYNGLRFGNTKINTITSQVSVVNGDVIVLPDIHSFDQQIGFNNYLFDGWKIDGVVVTEYIIVNSDIVLNARVDQLEIIY